jgi:ketosteroid isomerase-like protein
MMTTASYLLQQHIQTLVEDNEQWQTLIADDVVWELPYAPAIGHPARLSGRREVTDHVTWFLGAVENFRFFDVRIYALADPEAAVAEFKAEGLIKPTGRIYVQDYVLFLHAADGRIEPVSYFVWEGHEMISKGKQHDRYDDHQNQKDQSEGRQAIPG